MALISALFTPAYYLATQPDVRAAVEAGAITAFDHFILFGAKEGRSPAPLFNVDFYLSHNPDVQTAVNAGVISAVEHLIRYGSGESRQIDPFIHLGDYLNANPDLAEAAANSGLNALTHLLNYGVAEGRDLGNGIQLRFFANDPVFQQAVADGNAVAALERVGHIASFLPSFVSPKGWHPAPDTPLPVDFSPIDGLYLVVPESVVVPANTQLPDFIRPTTPPEPPPLPRPVSPPPGPTPPVSDDHDWPVFTVSNLNGEHVFGGTATGLITLHIDHDGLLSFSRGGITVKTTLDTSAWDAGSDVIRLRAGETLVISPEQASLLANGLDCGCTGNSFAVIGNGTVKLTTSTLGNPLDITDLLAIAPEVHLDFANSGIVTVPADNTVSAHPEHLNGIRLLGDGSVYVAGDGTGTWSPDYTGSARGPVTLDIGTNGAGNVIIATESNDLITVRGSGLSAIVPGKGADAVWLETETDGVSVITIEAGTAARYAADTQLQTSFAAEGHRAFIYIGTFNEGFITEFSNGAWGDLRLVKSSPIPSELSTLELAHGVSIDAMGLVTIVRDQPFGIYAAEQMDSSTHGLYPIINPTTSYGTAPYPADSHFWAMDEIHGFTPGKDMIHPARLYLGGNGESDEPLDDATFNVGGITFHIDKGLTKISTGSLPETGTLQYVLEQLSIHMGTNQRLTAYEYNGDTYLFNGDGTAGLAVSDMVVKLVGVKNLSSIDDILLGAVL